MNMKVYVCWDQQPFHFLIAKVSIINYLVKSYDSTKWSNQMIKNFAPVLISYSVDNY